MPESEGLAATPPPQLFLTTHWSVVLAAKDKTDPYLIQTEFEVLQSGEILEKVIENLGLNQEWGRRYNGGRPFSQAQGLALLKRSLDLRPVHNTSLIEIRVFEEEADKAAAIANEIARVYQNHVQRSATENGSTRAPVEIVDWARPGLRPVRPNKPVNLAIGALAGSLLGTVGGVGFAGYESRKRPSLTFVAASR